ncbi:hypothetical protein [Brevundimonas sp. A19_0]|uniref:hypothetical protein n=1 Tax=Brevundimonas sp. A19_0 TaxID=2821087 RepID=UPI001ADD1F5E|nr:hypothetical protein [Brevundimonas sp. A19_0]MBO9501725.1 hypothetical protein [Brevundimonas sp. A19_0]
MSLARASLAALAVFALAACDGSPAPEAPAPEAEAPAAPQPVPEAQASGALALEGEGLRAFTEQGSARPLPFGMAQDMTLTAVSTMLGADTPSVTTNSECGAGPMQFAEYPNGLQLAFQDDKFVGWFLDEGGLTTADGVGVGSTRAELGSARVVDMVPDSTLGVEFSSGALGGFLTSEAPDATVESLYAGMTCFFR